ncbi:hypothetical protein ES332_D12G197100v1 [Gossypium tomentosum]|nr:hypothetical protein ES332_D12G197100v1 [Gossypium tomentosum]
MNLLAVNPKMIYSFNRIAKSITKPVMYTIHSKFGKPHLNLTTLFKTLSTKPPQNGKDDSWNDAWETAWLPDDIFSSQKIFGFICDFI